MNTDLIAYLESIIFQANKLKDHLEHNAINPDYTYYYLLELKVIDDRLDDVLEVIYDQ